MTALESTEKKILETKLSGLRLQIEALLHDSFPYPDSERALMQLDTLTRKLLSQVAGFDHYAEPVRRGLALRARYILESYSELFGIIARSSATRNPFELYDPLKKLCRKILGDNIHLVLSSEWNYIPFTYPMNIQDLPDFIIIGMPATETENVLVFPAAAHEVGHSIWLVKNLNETVSPLGRSGK